MIAKTTFTYDNYQAMNGMDDYGGNVMPPGHATYTYNTTYTLRGNVTGVTRWTDLGANTSTTRLAKYDTFGNVVKAQVSCCQEKSYTYTQNTYWSQAEQVTSNGNTILTSSGEFDFNTSVAESQTDPRNQTVSYGYDSALRPSSAILPSGATQGASYNDGSLSTSSTTTYEEGGVQKTLTTTKQMDGWGRVIQEVNQHSVQVNTAYNAMGRVLRKTNPFQAGQQPAPVTTYQYDALGRMTVTTLPGGNAISQAYSGSSITITDQVNRKIKRETDGLGRLVKVTEQDQTGALAQETTYSYNLLDKVVLVNQGNQTRAFKYDSAGRLLFERIPEQTATINDGAGTFWSCKYTYTDFDEVATKQDARGVVTTYSYDTLHRVTQLSYNTTNAPGVAATPTVIYGYDNLEGSATEGLLTAVQVGSVDSTLPVHESYSYDSYNRVQSVTLNVNAYTGSSRIYTTSYQYNEIGQVNQMTYPSGAAITPTYDSKARLTSVGGYVNSISYNPIGQVSGVTLGNGVVESYGYDATRLQMTGQGATKNGSPLMSLGYSYQATAGQNGAGTVAGNTGQLMGVTSGSSIVGVAEVASYTYDNVGRLVTSSQTTNGVNAQRRFSYDRWGNRTGVWDAVSGGTQIQSVSLEQSAGAPTNRITSVTTNSVVASYSYDAVGNVTSDGVHSYQYDAENRVVSVDGGATASYGYDHKNRRVKKVAGGAVTHYVWQGNQVIAEHNGATGAQIVRYIYAGGRMVAKVEGTATRYFISDRLSVRVVLDHVGNVVGRQSHLPYGEEIGGASEQQKQHFTSYERDTETNTDYAVNRQYSYGTGRFMRVDPLGESLQDEYPQRWNRYSYTANDPINMKDPLGLFLGHWSDNSPCSFGPTVLIDGFDFFRGWCVGAFVPLPTPDPDRLRLRLPCPAQDFTFIDGSGRFTAADLSALAMTAVGEAGSSYNLDEVQAVIATAVNRQSYNIAYFFDKSQPHFGSGDNAPTQIIDILKDGYDALDVGADGMNYGQRKVAQAKRENYWGYLTLDHYVCGQLVAAKNYASMVGNLDRMDIFNAYPVTFNFADPDNRERRNARNRRHYGNTTFWNTNSGPPKLPEGY